jgi:hypothetical protein
VSAASGVTVNNIAQVDVAEAPQTHLAAYSGQYGHRAGPVDRDSGGSGSGARPSGGYDQ